MNKTAARGLARLREPNGARLQELARMVVDETTATPLRDIATPRWIAGQLAAAIEAGVQGDLAKQWVQRRIDAERDRWSTDERPVGELVPEEAIEPLRTLLGKAYAPSEDLVFRIIDQPAIRRLIREVLTSTLTRFRRRLQSVDKGVLGGFGGRAARRGRGLLGEVAGNLGGVAGNLGGVAENLVGAVRDEVEQSLDNRVKDFVGGATADVVRAIARYFANPEHAEAMGELRLAILDVVLATSIEELAAEADKLRPEDIIDVVVAALRSAVAAEDFVDRTEERIARILEETGDGTLGAWLDEVGLRDVWTQTTTELVAARLAAVVHTDAFEAWWGRLLR